MEDQGDAVDLCDEAVNVQGHNGYQIAAVDTEEIGNYEDEQPSEATSPVQDWGMIAKLLNLQCCSLLLLSGNLQFRFREP